MNRKISILLILVIIVVAIAGFFVIKNPKITSNPSESATPEPLALTINSKTVNLELANTEALRETGLGGRSFLDKDSGMLFVFDSKPVSASFWMKDMLIPLDIIWIKDGQIAKIDENVPFYPQGTPDNQLMTYTPSIPIDYVLEVNSGFSDTNKFKVGDSVILPPGL